jgi:hypothetical protein
MSRYLQTNLHARALRRNLTMGLVSVHAGRLDNRTRPT